MDTTVETKHGVSFIQTYSLHELNPNWERIWATLLADLQTWAMLASRKSVSNERISSSTGLSVVKSGPFWTADYKSFVLLKSFHHFFFSKLKRLNNGVPWMSSTSCQLNFLFTTQPNFIFLLQNPVYNFLHSFPLIFQSTKYRSNIFFKFLAPYG